MRRISFATAALVLAVTGTPFAQGFIQYSSRTDFFARQFPRRADRPGHDVDVGTRHSLPARVYSVENARGRFSMTVADYKDAEKLHTERSTQCQKNKGEGDACNNSWRNDVSGRHRLGHPAVPGAKRQGDVLRLVCGGPCRGPPVAAPQRGRIAHVRDREHARHAALYSRGNSAAGGACARSLSAVADVPRREGQHHSLSELLLADLFGRMEVPRAATAAREVIVAPPVFGRRGPC